ncbi:LLM class flavin-dependent oxidoreductase [Amantichitinum ursilacus]|uniref:Nitrilotriacetate monooxygenase component A n=1 Tax=Amantichitinum ursilacus TaxID=857265 RepID=A0A0N0GQ96_9NEIS|nr:LLM class flavin-dependent oxidoreductase [Amantichitinum ursilacus]KPC54213.1 Nitrilotriacetate monooxygenase component A [Amantichitinum ursilacus]
MSTQRQGQMSLGAFLMETGHHVAAWRDPSTPANGGLDFKVYKQVVQIAEQARFDMVFFADSVTAYTGAAAERMARSDKFEPITLLSALAAVTEHIGLCATATTTYNEPYHVARKFASLDHLSGGRAGWNLVTSDAASEAGNFGRAQHVGHAERYERAREFYEVVTGLWDSWDDDAFVRDKASGVYYDPAKLHVLNHKGKHFSVTGPLNVARPPQGRPVVIQAGSSETGRDLAAQTADVVFTAHTSLASAQAFYRDVKARTETAGRSRDSIRIMPGVYVVVAATREEAQQKHAALQALVDPEVGLSLLSRMIGNFDLRGVDLDGPLPELPLTDSGQRSRQELLTRLAGNENLTVRQLYERIAGGRGHFSVIGTGADVADALQAWFEGEGADGFNVMAPTLPGGLADFAEFVVPELQKRGLFRTEYTGATLRANLGLARP